MYVYRKPLDGVETENDCYVRVDDRDERVRQRAKVYDFEVGSEGALYALSTKQTGKAARRLSPDGQ